MKSAYPDSVTASHKMWLDWARGGIMRWLRWEWRIVVPATKADARIKSQIADILAEIEKTKAPDISDEDARSLRRERAALRAARDFEGADKIRDRLVAAGHFVSDQSLETFDG